MKKIVIANWKMNPQSAEEARVLFRATRKAANEYSKVITVVCPPFIFIPDLAKSAKGTKIAIGAQDSAFEAAGSYTGEISPLMLKNAGATHTIIGHSEVRDLGEDNERVRLKVGRALTENLRVVLCVGEKERDGQGEYLAFIREEIENALVGVPTEHLSKLIIAYEPIWAIGKTQGEALTPSDMHEMSIYIRKIISEIYDRDAAGSVPVVYGGSAEPGNVKDLLEGGDIDGFLVGHASLSGEDFSRILEITNAVR